MSILKRLALVTIVVLLFCQGSVWAQKFGYIDSEKIQKNYQEWARAQETFDAELRAWEQEAASMEQELQEMFQEYDRQKLILSAEKKTEKEAALQAKQQALESFTREISGPGGKAERRMQELVKPLYDKIQAAIERLAIEEGYDFIFNSSGLAYAKKELDVTDRIIEILEAEE